MNRLSRAVVTFVVAVCLLPLALPAQAPVVDARCPGVAMTDRVTQDACQKALDIFQFLAPQLGLAIAGGNAVLGEHSALRGPGRVSVGLRVNVINARLPRVDQHTPSVTGAQSSEYGVDEQYVPVPTLDAAVGLFRGFPMAGTYALSLDALVNVAFIPSFDDDEVSVDLPDGSLKFGFGGRLGLLQETFVTPGVSVTYLRRDLPVVDVTGRVGDDELSVRDVDVQTTAWRVVAGKNLALLGVSIGAGQDRYETEATTQVTVTRFGQSVTSAPIVARQELTRTSYFANLALNLSLLRIVGEIGRSSGGNLPTFNTFAGTRADDARTYGSLGLRISW